MKHVPRLLLVFMLLALPGCSTFRTQTSHLNERSEKARVHFARPKLAPPSITVNFSNKEGDIVDAQTVSKLMPGFVRYNFKSYRGDTLTLVLQNRKLETIGELRLSPGKAPIVTRMDGSR